MTNVEKLITVLVTPFQDLEDTLQQLLTERQIDTAVGVQLTAIGKLVGRDRNGVTDDEVFRRQVRAQIATNKSDGVTEDLITIATLIVDDDSAVYVVHNTGIASVSFSVEGVVPDADTIAVLISFLKKAVSAGVRIILTTWPSADEDDLFIFDDATDVGSITAGLGWEDDVSGGVGGMLINGLG